MYGSVVPTFRDAAMYRRRIEVAEPLAAEILRSEYAQRQGWLWRWARWTDPIS